MIDFCSNCGKISELPVILNRDGMRFCSDSCYNSYIDFLEKLDLGVGV